MNHVPEISTDEVFQVCRACLKTDGQMYTLEENDTLWSMFQDVTGLVVTVGQLPHSLCGRCKGWLRDCTLFRSSSRRAHAHLQELLRLHPHISAETIKSITKSHSQISLDTVDSYTNWCDTDSELVIKDEDIQTEQEIYFTDEPEFTVEVKVESDNENDCDNMKEVTDDNDKMEIGIDDNLNIVVDNVCSLKETDAVKIENEQKDLDGAQVTNDVTCGTTFADEDGASDDERSLGELTLPKLPKDFKPIESDSEHQEATPSLKGEFECEICPYVTSYLPWLLSHLKAHGSTKSYSCSQCSYITVYKNALDYHLKTHSGEKPYSCTVCDESFRTKYCYSQHLSVHFGGKVYSCDFCVETFRRMGRLRQHLKQHVSVSPYKCDVCKKEFKYKCFIRHHIRENHFGEKYMCNVCGQSFKTAQCLKTHMRDVSRGKAYKCHICCKRFWQDDLLTEHLRKHTDETYSCSVCKKVLKNTYCLKHHMLVHSEKKPHECSFCSKGFRRKSELLSHIMKVHTGERPYSCDI